MADYETFYRKARALRIEADDLVEEYRRDKGLSLAAMVRLLQLGEGQIALLTAMKEASLNLEASPDIMEHLQRVSQVREEFEELLKSLLGKFPKPH